MEATPRALIVDDERDIAELLAICLHRDGYETVLACSASDALETAAAENFDVVISDIGMPGMNGYELAERLRAMPAYRHTPLVAITGYAFYDDRQSALQAGFDHHLTKPILPQTLLDIIKRLRGRQSR